MTEKKPDADFVVRNAFKVTGRGTCVGGYISSGAIHSGDRLEWFDGTVERQCTCRGVSGVRTVPILDPPTVAFGISPLGGRVVMTLDGTAVPRLQVGCG